MRGGADGAAARRRTGLRGGGVAAALRRVAARTNGDGHKEEKAKAARGIEGEGGCAGGGGRVPRVRGDTKSGAAGGLLQSPAEAFVDSPHTPAIAK